MTEQETTTPAEQTSTPSTQTPQPAAGLAERDGRIAELEQEAGSLRAELAESLSRYRASLLASAPEVPQEMVQGATARELDEAFTRARTLVERIRSEVEAKASRERVPAGAPVRSRPDLSGLTPRDKIAHGLADKQP